MRRQITSDFWSRQTPDIHSMFLHKDAPLLDSLERTEILTLLPSFKDKTVLDLASGIGRFTKEFAKTAKKVVSLDFSPQFIEASKMENSNSTNIEWICSDAMDASFQPKQFDLIFISWLFMYLEPEELMTLIENLRKWLKPSGHLFFRESCAATTRFKCQNGYYVHYRSLLDYDQMFKQWKLVKQGATHAYEDLHADPFKCYWLYQP
jgi:phosphoethanolamine N-methyltransferase